MHVIIVRVKNKSELHPLVMGLLERNERHPVGSISDPDFKDGYYHFAIRDDASGPDMIYTYEDGELKKEEYI